MEEQFYLLWPLLLLAVALLARRSPRFRRHARRGKGAAAVLLVLVGAGSLAASLHLTVVDQPFAFFSLPSRPWEFVAGAAVALGAGGLRRLPAGVAGALGWGGLGTIITAVLALRPGTAYPGTAALLPVLGAAGLLAGGCADARWGPQLLLGMAPLQQVGRVSYSFYLWHWPPLVLVPVALGHPLPVPLALLVVGLAWLAATATTLLLEEPVRSSRRISARPGRGLALGAALTLAGCACALATAAALPGVRGRGAAVSTPALSAAGPAAVDVPIRDGGPGGGRSVRRPPTPLEAAEVRLRRVLTAAEAVQSVPANLQPALDVAHADRRHRSWTAAIWATTGAGHPSAPTATPAPPPPGRWSCSVTVTQPSGSRRWSSWPGSGTPVWWT